MSSEEKMQWKKKEDQKKDQMEKLNEMEEILLAEGSYNDQIVIYDEESKESERSQEKKENEDNLETIEESKNQQVIHEEGIKEKICEENIQREQAEEKREEYKEKITENEVIEEEKEEQKIEQVENQDTNEVEEREKRLEELRGELLKQEKYTDQKIIWEDVAQKKRVERINGEPDSIEVSKELERIEDKRRFTQKSTERKEKTEKYQKEGSSETQREEKSVWKESIDNFIKEVNTQLQLKKPLESQIFDKLNEFCTTGAYPNLVFVYKKDGRRSLQLLDKKLFNQLINSQIKPTFRLEWHRDWFIGFERKKSAINQRKLFLLDLTNSQMSELPSDMKRVWVIKNEPKWNYLSPTKRELHGSSITSLMNYLFGKRNKVSDFNGVTRYSYEKAMNKIWIEFQTIFTSEIRLKAKNRPAIKALKANFSRESVEHTLIGSFWYYYYNLRRKRKKDLEKGGYNSLVEYLKNDAPKVIPVATDTKHQIHKMRDRKTLVKAKKSLVDYSQVNSGEIFNRKFNKLESNTAKLDSVNILEKLHLDSKSFIYISHESQQNFVKAWNWYVKSKCKPSIGMWRIYNKIQKQCDSPLLYIHSKDDRPRLRLKREIKEAEILHNKTLEKFPNLKNTTLIAEWLKFRQKIEGKSPLIEVKIINPLNNKEELWFIRNNRNHWNPEGLPFKNNTAEKRFVSSEFFEEWRFRNKSYNIKLGEIKGYMPHSIKKSIINTLFSQTSVPNGTVFTHAYKLRMNAETIDKFFEWLWNKDKENIKQIDETRPILQSLENFYKDIKIGDKILNVEINEKFDVYLFDKSRCLFKSLFSDLQDIVDYKQTSCQNLEDWWELIKRNITVSELANSLLRATHAAHINKLPICYRFYDATTSRFGPLCKDPIRFWNETYSDSFSGLAAALMENKEIRRVIESFANEENNLCSLKLRKGVITEMTGHYTFSSDHLISVPDGFTKKGRIGSDIFQNKLLRPIGGNLYEMKAEYYLLDWLKTVGNYDPINFSINNLQLEFIPWGASLNDLTNIARDHNAIIISYWGKTAPEIGRFMEVISAIRISCFKRQKEQNYSEEELKRLIIDNLEKRTYLRTKIDKLDLATKQIIDQFLPEGVRATGEGMFLKNSLINLLKSYGDKLFFDYYPSEAKE